MRVIRAGILPVRSNHQGPNGYPLLAEGFHPFQDRSHNGIILPDRSGPGMGNLSDQPLVVGADRANGVLAVGFRDQGTETAVEF